MYKQVVTKIEYMQTEIHLLTSHFSFLGLHRTVACYILYHTSSSRCVIASELVCLTSHFHPRCRTIIGSKQYHLYHRLSDSEVCYSGV